jgi:LEA14-like dessication related protein
MMTDSRFARGSVLLLLLALLTGCASRVFKQPQVELESVQIGGLGLRGGTLLVNLEVVNPNRFALNANQLQYDLALSDPEAGADTTWIDFASGTHDEPVSIAAGDTARITIPVDFSYSGLGTAANSLLRRGTFTYRASGIVDVRTPLGSYGVPFRKRGNVNLLGGR